MPKINVENAQIKTAAIEIKALTVSGKQVTQSVFKQLQEECCIDFDSITLKGLLWGHVNFKVNESELNIIWQLGKELKRCVLLKHLNYFIDDHIYYFRAKKLFLEDINLYFNSSRSLCRLRDGSGISTDGLYCYGLSSVISDLKRGWMKDEEKLKHEKNIEERNEKLKEVEINISAQINIIDNKIDKYNKLLESLSDLPQLFIAV